MARTHGKPSTYRWGCRCIPCTKANASHKRSTRKSSEARLSADPTFAEHGREGTYTNRCCRCRPCTAAHADYTMELKAARAAKLAADPTAAPHGRASTYTNWACRCEPCTTAHAQDRAKARGKAAVS